MHCSMCGHEFEPAEAGVACAGCPLVPGCHLLRCPRCGYEMPPEAKLVSLIRKLRTHAPLRTHAASVGTVTQTHKDISR
jgi:hypothetical protein